MKRIALAVFAFSALAASGCDDKKTESTNTPSTTAVPANTPANTPSAVPAAAPTAAPAAAAPAAGPAQSIKGTVAFTGAAPAVAPQNRAADPYCNKTKANDESIVVNGNKTLKNVYVRITSGITGALPPPPTEKITIEQHECNYRPRMQGVVAGQTIEVKNGDQTLHNVHTYKGTTTLFNQAQIAGSAPIDKIVKDDMAMLKFKCDVHPWMTGFIGVQNHPWFAVTGDDGSFELKNVPPGNYKLEAWHEKFGTKSVDVVVADKAAEAKFAFDGTEK